MMDAVTAQVLAALILTSTQGADRLKSQLPLHAIDRGGSWLVKGSPSFDPILKLQYCIFSVFLDKKTAQVLAIDFSGRPQLSDDQKKYWHQKFSPEEFDRIFGPPTVFEPDGRYLDLNRALYGGVINKPEDAVAFAYALMKSNPGVALIPERALQATERDGAWHVSAQIPGQAKLIEVLSFSRYDGKVLSGP
jgi:hypothetical protein